MPSPVTLRLSGSHKSCLFCRVLSSENYFGPHILFPRANKPSKHHKAPHPPELSPTSRESGRVRNSGLQGVKAELSMASPWSLQIEPAFHFSLLFSI